MHVFIEQNYTRLVCCLGIGGNHEGTVLYIVIAIARGLGRGLELALHSRTSSDCAWHSYITTDMKISYEQRPLLILF